MYTVSKRRLNHMIPTTNPTQPPANATTTISSAVEGVASAAMPHMKSSSLGRTVKGVGVCLCLCLWLSRSADSSLTHTHTHTTYEPACSRGDARMSCRGRRSVLSGGGNLTGLSTRWKRSATLALSLSSPSPLLLSLSPPSLPAPLSLHRHPPAVFYPPILLFYSPSPLLLSLPPSLSLLPPTALSLFIQLTPLFLISSSSLTLPFSLIPLSFLHMLIPLLLLPSSSFSSTYYNNVSRNLQ